MSIITKPASWRRIPQAGRYSWQGLRALYCREAAFRQEVWLFAVTTPCVWGWAAIPLWAAFAVTASALGVLIAEAFNSAFEALVDYLAPERHVEVGYVKDVGSAAVFIALAIWVLSWGVAVWSALAR